MDSSNPTGATGLTANDPFIDDAAVLNTNIDPSNTSSGLKNTANFAVNGLFDLSSELDNRDAYGIRLSDKLMGGGGPTATVPADQLGTETVQLSVYRGTDGVTRVQLSEFNGVAGTVTQLQTFALNPGVDNQIMLTLSHVANTNTAQAQFELANNGVLDAATLQIFTVSAPIFDNEDWTRAEFLADAPQVTDSILQGTYGTLDLTQAGAWTYALNNSAANVQALAQGQTATDSFTVQVADSQGATSTQTINVTVSGTNDSPVANPDFAAVTASGVNPGNTPFVGTLAASGNVLTNDTDVDTIDTHSVTKVNGATGNVGQDVVGIYGTLHLNSDGTYTYTLGSGTNTLAHVQALAQGATATACIRLCRIRQPWQGRAPRR